MTETLVASFCSSYLVSVGVEVVDGVVVELAGRRVRSVFLLVRALIVRVVRHRRRRASALLAPVIVTF